MKSQIRKINDNDYTLKEMFISDLENDTDIKNWKNFKSRLMWPLKGRKRKQSTSKNNYLRLLKTIGDLTFKNKDNSNGYFKMNDLSLKIKVKKKDLYIKIKNLNTWGFNYLGLNAKKNEYLIERERQDSNRFRLLIFKLIIENEVTFWFIDEFRNDMIKLLDKYERKDEHKDLKSEIEKISFITNNLILSNLETLFNKMSSIKVLIGELKCKDEMHKKVLEVPIPVPSVKKEIQFIKNQDIILKDIDSEKLGNIKKIREKIKKVINRTKRRMKKSGAVKEHYHLLVGSHLLLGNAEFGIENFNISEKNFKNAYQYVSELNNNKLKEIALLGLGASIGRQGRPNEALMYYEEVLKLNPKNSFALNCKGVLFYLLGMYEDALKHFNEVNNRFPNNVGSLYGIGLTLINLNKYEKAINYIDKALIRKSNDENLLYAKGAILLDLKRNEEAIKYFNKVLKQRPNDVESLFGNGYANLKLKRNEEAIKYFNKVLKQKPNDVESLANKGVAYLLSNEYGIATRCFNEVLKQDQSHLTSLISNGYANLKLKRNEEAIKYFNKVLKQKPNHVFSLANKGLTHLILNEPDLADKCFNKVFEVDPNNKDSLFGKYIILLSLAKYEDAYIYFNKWLEQNPTNLIILDEICQDIIFYNEHNIAIKYFNNINKFKPDCTNAWYYKASIYSQRKWINKSLESLKNAIELDNSYIEKAEKDPEFDNIKDDPRFKKLIQKYKEKKSRKSKK
jgi:tetratricopeptide (TPR) repeat protein